MSLPLMSHKIACLVPSCGKKVSRNRSGNYSGHKWANTSVRCIGGGTPAFEINDGVSFNLAGHAVYGRITWLGWDTTGPRPGALAKVEVGDKEFTLRTALLSRSGRVA